jgi:hypothetical protein
MKPVRGAGTRPGRYNGLGITPRSFCTGGVRRLVCQWGVLPIDHVLGLDSFAHNNDRTGLIWTTFT